MSFTPIKSILPGSADRSGMKDEIEAQLVLDSFLVAVRRELGDRVADKLKPLYVKNGTLTVSCLSSVLASELKLKEKRIIERVNTLQKKDVVQRLRFFL
ncbi:DUF721 domain-containing protein [Candidatus Uhrbacteria bacterium]|nr:DUF721 domain-containing protein [Candidatus Uhrbacteria bacterium]